MSRIRIVTDSTADLPGDIIKRYGITVVPLKVFFGREVFLDGVEITPDEFFRRQVAGEVSTTSQPSPVEFVDCYRPFVDAGDEIISIHISGSMSGTVQSANLARTMLEYPQLEVIDSGVVSVALGIMVVNAARAVAAGKTRAEISAMVKDMQRKLRVYFMVDTLEYLQRGGRIGRAQVFLGTLLNVKPLLTFRDGLVHPHEKVRGRTKACDRIVSLMQEEYGEGRRIQCWVAHGAFPEGLEMVKRGLSESFDCVEMITSRLGPVVGTHGGPGLVGAVCLPADF